MTGHQSQRVYRSILQRPRQRICCLEARYLHLSSSWSAPLCGSRARVCQGVLVCVKSSVFVCRVSLCSCVKCWGVGELARVRRERPTQRHQTCRFVSKQHFYLSPSLSLSLHTHTHTHTHTVSHLQHRPARKNGALSKHRNPSKRVLIIHEHNAHSPCLLAVVNFGAIAHDRGRSSWPAHNGNNFATNLIGIPERLVCVDRSGPY